MNVWRGIDRRRADLANKLGQTGLSGRTEHLGRILRGQGERSVSSNGLALVACGLLAGLVVAAAAFPAAAMSGLAAKAGAETFDQLPNELTVKQAPQISYVYANDGRTLLATMYDENRSDTKLADISPIMQKAIVAAEDHKFFQHNGVDPKGIARAFVANGSGQNQQGGSTLTMQYVRLAISYSAERPADVVAATEDTPARKLREIRYALSLEKQLSKNEILERYLNIAPFGNGAYGVFAAAKVYFNKRPLDLNIQEAAMLAGMVKAPSAFNPTTPAGLPQALDRRNYVIQQMVATGAITPSQGIAAQATKLVVNGVRTPNGCTATPINSWGFFCDYFVRWWLDQKAFGDTPFDRERTLKTHGYKIVTTLDPKVQAYTKNSIERRLATGSHNALMVAAVEPGSGRVRALATNRNYGLDDPAHPKNKPSTDPAKRRLGIRGSYPTTTNPLITGGGDIKGYQAGSTFKMFTAVAALEHGLPLATTIKAVSPLRTDYTAGYGEKSACPGSDKWCPVNASPGYMNGMRTMWSGFERSVNTYFIRLEETVGADKAVEAAKQLGIQFRESDDARRASSRSESAHWGAFTLGVAHTTPLDLANAYATLAADGKYCAPTPVQEIRDQNGVALDSAKPQCHQAVRTEVARAAIDMARCPVGDSSSTSHCQPPGTAAEIRGAVGAPVAGKTGTTDGNATATLVVTAKRLAMAGILADPDWADTGDYMSDDVVNATVAEAMRNSLQGVPNENFTPPSGSLVNGVQDRIPDVSCMSIDDAKARLSAAGFAPSVGGTVASKCPPGEAAGTSPSGQTISGGPVDIQVSGVPKKGKRPIRPGRATITPDPPAGPTG